MKRINRKAYASDHKEGIEELEDKLKKFIQKYPQDTRTTNVNNYYVNTNFSSRSSHLSNTNNRVDSNDKLISDLTKGLSILKETENYAKGIRIINLVVVIIAIMIILSTIIFQAK